MELGKLKLIKGDVIIPGVGAFPQAVIAVQDATTAFTRATLPPLDTPSLAASLARVGSLAKLGPPNAIIASCEAWTSQDDDAHDTCSLTACLNPLHPGPCKGWKHTLHAVSPGAWHQLETERVRKANIRREARIADLRTQGKPVPRRLLAEVKPKPAPGPHAPGAPPAVAPGQIGQKAGAAGGQAHRAGQTVSNAAGVQVKQAPPLPLGPKQKKPSVAGRGPAFVITQPKVTDQYKLDKASKITPQEWAGLSDADKTTIRNELTAIKARGFGPQQKKSDELLAKLAAPAAGSTLKPGTPGTITTPKGNVHQVVNVQPGKVSLGQAIKPITPQLAAPAPSTHRGQRDQNGILVKAAPGGAVTATSVGLPPGYRISRDSMGYSLKHNGKLIRTSSDQAALEKYAHDHAKGDVSGHAPSVADQIKAGTASTLKPAAPLAPGIAPHVQHAAAVANRTAPKAQMAKTHLDAYGKLTKADFDSLPADQQKTIRDDLANARAKFLDPKKQQEATQLLDRFGSSHTPAAPSPAGVAKPYSDPMNQAVKAAHGADDVEMFKRVGALTPGQVKSLDDADRKTVLSRLAFIATHPKADQAAKDRAAAYERIINKGTPAATSRKWDHEPSIGELHAEETKTGIARAVNPAVTDALKAADDVRMPKDDRIKALTALTRADFDKLKPDEQHKIVDTLQGLHHNPNDFSLNDDVGKAITTYTGLHPAMHRMQAAEAKFKAGKYSGEDVHTAHVLARVQASSRGDGSARAALSAEAARIAKDNPGLPPHVRVALAGEPAYGGTAYRAITQAGIGANWDKAPRLTGGDIGDIFGATETDLAKADPIHAQAVKDLREHLIRTGLAGDPGTGSPWSAATREHVVNQLLQISEDSPEVPADRLKLYQSLSPADQISVRRVLRSSIDSPRTSNYDKTAKFIALRALEGRPPFTGAKRDAVLAATRRFVSRDSHDAYRRLDPQEFDELPTYTKLAILDHLGTLQTDAERAGPTRTWNASLDDPLRVFPEALADHLGGARTPYGDRRMQNASDIANYGQKIINPYDRYKAYGDMSAHSFSTMSTDDRTSIAADLDSIASDTRNPLPVRYGAQFTKDITLQQGIHLTVPQMTAIGSVHPAQPIADSHVINNLGAISKADYDSLDKVYRDAIDERIKTLPAAPGQALTAQFHPQAPAVNPSGYKPTTTQANVPPHVQAALDTIYGVHSSGKSHTMAHQLSTYGALRGSDFGQLNAQEQTHLLGDLSFIATTAKGPSADKARKLIDRFTPAGTAPGHVPTPASIPPANAVPGQQRYPTPLKGALVKATDSGKSGDKWIYPPGHSKVWGEYGAAGLLIKHTDPNTGEERYLMVQRGPAISDPGKWTFPGGAIDSKETPHQGAARETLEELGLKDDQLKDAVIHGDHTYSIPGSTWKYTTVAAQAPKMFQPNLSTAHARAETSDAKWMTLDEIRALDTAGKLHGPIAGGKLEQNVISLYPPAGVKLGQIVRPGPVTKRQGRLSMPPGGRQAPSSFNAWPHPHKQSTGKNLVVDKTAIDKIRQEVKRDRVRYDGKTADGRLAAIGAMQGFDDTPTVVDKKEMDRLLATGDYIEAWRGVAGAGGNSWRGHQSGGKTAAQIHEDFRSGTAYYGKGIFGNGFYLATQKSVAEQYSDHTKNSVMRVLIPKTALTEHYNKIEKEAHAASSPRSKAKGGSYENGTLYDPGRWAAARGIDGIEIQAHHTSGGGWARHIAKPGRPAYNWLNRSVLIVQEAQ